MGFLVINAAAFIVCWLLVCLYPHLGLNWFAAGICSVLLVVQIVLFSGGSVS